MLLYKHFGSLTALYADYNTCCGTLEAYTLEIVVLYCTFGFAYSHIFYAGTLVVVFRECDCRHIRSAIVYFTFRIL